MEMRQKGEHVTVYCSHHNRVLTVTETPQSTFGG